MSHSPRRVLDTASGWVHPAALRALTACAEAAWADPSGPGVTARRAADLLVASQVSLASTLGTPREGLRVLSGGGRAVSEGLRGLLTGVQLRAGLAPTLVVSEVDHSAALRVARWWEQAGHPVRRVRPGPLGRVSAESLAEAADGAPAVVCVQVANGESGTIHEAAEALRLLAPSGSAALLEATAAAGHLDLPGGFDAVAATALSWGGPRGVGLLGLSPDSPWRSPAPEIPDEVPVGLVVAAAAALEDLQAHREVTHETARAQIDRIRQHLTATVDGLDLPGDPIDRLAHVLSVSALYADGVSLATGLDRRGLVVGSGSACASDSGEPSHVLAAMGALSGGNIRLSLPPGTEDSVIDDFLTAYPEVVGEVRTSLGAP